VRAWRTSSSLNGLMIAITSFIDFTPPCLRLPGSWQWPVRAA
jgi:hypothetical protein